MRLGETLIQWAERKTDPLAFRANDVVKGIGTLPTGPDDENVKRVLWALSDQTGKTAKALADTAPIKTPSDYKKFIAWVEIFNDAGLLERPAPLQREGGPVRPHPAPLVGGSWVAQRPPDPDIVTRFMAVWLAQHAHVPELVQWVIGKGACLHPYMRDLLIRQLAANSDDVPDNVRRVWQLILHDNERRDVELLFFGEHIKSATDDDERLLLERSVISSLSPRLSFRRPLVLSGLIEGEDTDGEEDQGSISNVARIEIEIGKDMTDFSTHLIKSAVKTLCEDDPDWLAKHAFEITGKIRAALELLMYLGRASETDDPSYWDRPSISDHEQNSDFRAWTYLLTLARDAYAGLARTDPDAARLLLQMWRSQSFPAFKRLVLHAVTEDENASADWCANLLSDDGHTLWHSSTQRECLRFLRKAAHRISANSLERLIEVVLAGPPRAMFREDLEDERWERIVDREVWLRLTRIGTACGELSEKAKERVEDILGRCGFKSRGDQDEFPVWMESGWVEPDPIKLDNLLKLGSPALVEKLRTYEPEGVGSSDEIRQLATKEPQRTIDALRIIGETHEEWPHAVWRHVLWGLEDDRDVATKVSQDLALLIVQAPDDLLTEVGHAISTWLRKVIGSDTPNPDVRHMELWKRVWNTAPEEDTAGTSDPLTAAINDRAGVLAEALLNILWARKPKTDEGIPPDLLPLFDLISQGTRPSHVFGRVILASRLYNLFALDPDWSSRNLLQRMDWDVSEEAAFLWAGYLWSPRVGPNLGAAFKNLFIKAIANRHEIDRHGENLVGLFAAMSTEMPEILSEPETKRIVDGLDEGGLVEVVHYFKRSAQAADKEQQGRIWNEKYGLWLDQYWPRVADRKTPQTAKSIAEYLCETGTAFPEAFSWAESFLQPVEYPGSVTHKLVKCQLPKEFPEETLRFVSKVMSADGPAHERYKLRELLDQIVETAPHLRTHPTYLALDQIA